jgi:hypothetical protein
MTEIPANTARPIGRTDSFLPGIANAACVEELEEATAADGVTVRFSAAADAAAEALEDVICTVMDGAIVVLSAMVETPSDWEGVGVFSITLEDGMEGIAETVENSPRVTVESVAAAGLWVDVAVAPSVEMDTLEVSVAATEAEIWPSWLVVVVVDVSWVDDALLLVATCDVDETDEVDWSAVVVVNAVVVVVTEEPVAEAVDDDDDDDADVEVEVALDREELMPWDPLFPDADVSTVTVQFWTSCTAGLPLESVMGVRVMVHCCVMGPTTLNGKFDN